MKCIAGALFLMTCLSLSLSRAHAQASAQESQTKPAHDREFWRSIAKSHYAVPEGQQVFPLLLELSGYVGSRDSELRDDLGYSITTTWIKHQDVPTADLNSLMDEWCANLRVGIGDSGDDSVLKRSFSALSLVALAERDLKTPFLTEERYRTLLDASLTYLKDERDLRGFDPKIGWIHATAHTADLLAALAMNPMFKLEDQGRVLNAITARLSSAHEIFTFGEQDRLSLVAARVVGRKDVEYDSGFDQMARRDGYGGSGDVEKFAAEAGVAANLSERHVYAAWISGLSNDDSGEDAGDRRTKRGT